MHNNVDDFLPHRVSRGFKNGIPRWDFVIILYRPLTPKGRKSKIKKIFRYMEKYEHGTLTDIEKANEALANGQSKKKPYLPKNYTWKPQLMRVD